MFCGGVGSFRLWHDLVDGMFIFIYFFIDFESFHFGL